MQQKVRGCRIVLGALGLALAAGPGCADDDDSDRADAAPDMGGTTDAGGPSDGALDGRATDGADAPAAVDATDAAPDVGPDAPPDMPPAATQAGVLTQHNDNARTGAVLNETTLTPVNVNMTSFGKLYCRDVDDEIYAQILYAAQVDLGAQGRKNVVFVATMANTVYAFDADATGGGPAMPLWERNLGTPLTTEDLPHGTCGYKGTTGNYYRDISRNIGILSTPVIDPATGTMYLVARSKEPGPKFLQRLHALDLATGAERPGSPVTIEATIDGKGEGSKDGKLTFDPLIHNQRPSLMLLEGEVYIAWASHCDFGDYHGWLLTYDAASLQPRRRYVTTPDGKWGGIWMSGQAPAADENGDVFLSTGNGTVSTAEDGPNRSLSVLRLGRTGDGLVRLDHFTPFNHDYLNRVDRDLGSAGVLLIPDSKYLVTGSKEGKLYLLDRTNLGKLAAGDGQIPQSLNIGPNQSHIHGSPVYWRNEQGAFVYVMAEEDYLKQLRLSDGKLTMYAQSPIGAPDEGSNGYTMPGGMLSISANGSKDGIVWVNTTFTRSANQSVVGGTLMAFDATDVSKLLWTSRQDAVRDDFGTFAKFTAPTVYAGRVYLATFSKRYCVYGLLNANP